MVLDVLHAPGQYSRTPAIKHGNTETAGRASCKLRLPLNGTGYDDCTTHVPRLPTFQSEWYPIINGEKSRLYARMCRQQRGDLAIGRPHSPATSLPHGRSQAWRYSPLFASSVLSEYFFCFLSGRTSIPNHARKTDLALIEMQIVCKIKGCLGDFAFELPIDASMRFGAERVRERPRGRLSKWTRLSRYSGFDGLPVKADAVGSAPFKRSD